MTTRRLYIINPLVLQMYEDGHSSREIAEQFCCSTSGVEQALKREGVKLRRQNKYMRDERHHKMLVIKGMRSAGSTYQQIANKFGVSRQAVHQMEEYHAQREAT